MEYNKSLSARIRRRNKCGFAGVGTGLGFSPFNKQYGDYTDSKQNHKDVDYKNDIARKNKLGFRKTIVLNKDGIPVGLERGTHRVMSKRYADNHQKATK